MSRVFVAVLTLALSIPVVAEAVAPTVMPFQARLVDGSGTPISGNVEFAIFATPAGGTAVWGPETHNVTPQNGIVTVMLGSVSDPFTAADFASAGRYLEIKVGGVALTPRIQLGSSAFAYGVAANSIGTAEIETGGVTSSDILDGTITGADVANGSLTGADISGLSDVDISDEPGVAYFHRTADLTVSSTDVTVITGSINIPTSGYVVATGNARGQAPSGFVRIAVTTGTTLNIDRNAMYYSGGVAQMAQVQDVFFFSTSGVKTIRLVADGSGTSSDISQATLLLRFFPTSYGTVQEPPVSPAAASGVSGTPNGP